MAVLLFGIGNVVSTTPVVPTTSIENNIECLVIAMFLQWCVLSCSYASDGSAIEQPQLVGIKMLFFCYDRSCKLYNTLHTGALDLGFCCRSCAALAIQVFSKAM